jgi:surface antigen
LRARLLAACLFVVLATPLIGAAPASADTVSSLIAQRQQLQQQVAGLGGPKAQALQDLLAAQDALHNNQAELDHVAAQLASLNQQLATTQAKIDVARQEIEVQRHMLADLTRGQYKQLSGDDSLSAIFSAQNFGQMVNQVMANQSVNRRISDTARKLKDDERALSGMSDELTAKKVQAVEVQAQLEQQNGRQVAMVADFDARYAALDASAKDLNAQIALINRQIAAAQAPPPSFSSGGGFGGGGGSCGNHFTYGFCTWYVANRRCIPWFGNANEWYANAQSYGFPVGSQARVGAVVVWGSGGGYGSVGHVGYVESVQADGFTVSEMNYNGWNTVNTRFVSYSMPGPLMGFIYGK